MISIWWLLWLWRWLVRFWRDSALKSVTKQDKWQQCTDKHLSDRRRQQTELWFSDNCVLDFILNFLDFFQICFGISSKYFLGFLQFATYLSDRRCQQIGLWFSGDCLCRLSNLKAPAGIWAEFHLSSEQVFQGYLSWTLDHSLTNSASSTVLAWKYWPCLNNQNHNSCVVGLEKSRDADRVKICKCDLSRC